MAIRYRDLQGPTLVDTTPLETGDSQAATALANAFKQFEGVALEPAANLRAEQGRQEGAAAGSSGDPEFRAGMRAMTAYGEAYNNAALRSYAIRSEADAEDQAARLEVEAQNSPEKFAATFGAVRDSTLKNAPPQARGVLATIYQQRLGTGVARLRTAQAVELNKLARADTAEGVERTVDRIANLEASDDPADYEQSLEEQAKLTLMIDGAVNDGTISRTEGVALHKNSQRMLVAQTVSARFRRVLDSPYGNPVDFIEKLRAENRTSEALSPKEEEALVDQLVGELRQHNTLMSAEARQNSAEVAARYEAGDREATAALLGGELTTEKLRTMVMQKRLYPSRATSLHNELTSGGTAADDPKEAFTVRTHLLSYTDEQIAENPKLTWKTRGELLLKKRDMEQTWKGTQQAREGEDRIKRALGIPPGTVVQMLSDEQKDQLDRSITQWYDEVDKLPPAERQANVIQVAEHVISQVIRKNKAGEAQEQRHYRENYLQRQIAEHGPRGEWGEELTKTVDRNLAGYDERIRAAEAEAARK